MATDAEKAKVAAETAQKREVVRTTMHAKVADGLDRGIQVVKVATARLSESLDTETQESVDEALVILRGVRDSLRGANDGDDDGDDDAPGDNP